MHESWGQESGLAHCRIDAIRYDETHDKSGFCVDGFVKQVLNGNVSSMRNVPITD